MRTLRQIKVALVPVLTAAACYLGAASTAGCFAPSGDSKAESPVTTSAQASSATADVTNIASYGVESQQGSLLLSAKDATGAEIAKFTVTKAPLVKYEGGVLPVTMVDETGASGATLHAESASVYPYRDDLSRMEFELFGVGPDNLIIRWAYDADGVLTRVSLFAYHAELAAGAPRLATFMSNQLHTAAPFDLPANYGSLDEYLDAWIDASDLDTVFNNDELDNVFFTLRDPTWLQAVVAQIASSGESAAQSVSDEGISIQNTGGTGGTGSSGKGSSSSKGSSTSKGKAATGSKAKSSSSGTSKGKKSGQVNSCDSSSIGGFLSGVLSNVTKSPTSAITGAKACSSCVSGLTGSSDTKSGTSKASNTGVSPTTPGSGTSKGTTGKTSGSSKSTKSSKASNTKSHIASTAKAVKKPKATASSSSTCSACEKFLSNTGVTKAATCLIGKVTNGSLGKSKSGTATNSKGNSPADDMSDDCDGSSCDDAKSGDTCTMGTDTCDFDDDQDSDDSGNFDLGSADDSGDDVAGDFGDFGDD